MYNNNLNQGSVCASLALMVIDFCNHHHLVVPSECYLYELDDRIPFNIWCSILNEVQSQHNVTALGLKIAEFIQPAYAGIISYLSFSKPTLFETIPEFIHYGRLAYDFNSMHFQVHDTNIEFSWGDYLARPGLLIDENAIALLVNIAKFAISPHHLPLKCVKFIYEEPDNIDIYQKYFNCPIYFNSPTTSLIFSIADTKNINLPKPDLYLHHILKKHADLLLEKLSDYNHFEQKIRLCVITNIKNKKINSGIVAEQMGMSSKTLRELLSNYGYTFNDIISEVRLDLAKKYLMDENLSIYEISDLLGYSEQSVFQRAFKSWTNLTPLKWRNNHLAG